MKKKKFTIEVKSVSSHLTNSKINSREMTQDDIDSPIYVEVKDPKTELKARKTHVRYIIKYPGKTVFKAGGYYLFTKENGTIMLGNTPYSDLLMKLKDEKYFKSVMFSVNLTYHDHINNEEGKVILYRKLSDFELTKKIKGLSLENEVLKKIKGLKTFNQ